MMVGVNFAQLYADRVNSMFSRDIKKYNRFF